jgi:hypothetical protein
VNLRITASIVLETNSTAYRDLLQRVVVPRYEVADGVLSVFVVTRYLVAYVELDILSFWDSEQAMAQFASAEALTTGVGSDLGVIHLDERTYTVAWARTLHNRNTADGTTGEFPKVDGS